MSVVGWFEGDIVHHGVWTKLGSLDGPCQLIGFFGCVRPSNCAISFKLAYGEFEILVEKRKSDPNFSWTAQSDIDSIIITNGEDGVLWAKTDHACHISGIFEGTDAGFGEFFAHR